MTLAPILALAARSAVNRRATVTLTVIAVALSVGLFAGVEIIRHAARASFERTISGADLIVGARSGPVNLMLYAVFHIGDATNNISWRSYEEIAARDEVAWTVPLSLGDSHHGFRVVGTTTDFFTRYRYGDEQALAFASGAPFADVFDAVVGAGVARELGYRVGDEIVVAHGLGAVSFAEHADTPFRVAGILAPSGTPVDRSVLVGLGGIEAIHIGWEGGARNPRAAAVSPDGVRALDLEPTEITAFIMGLNSPIAALRLQREINTYREEPLLAVMPGVALSQLWQVVGVVERTLASISLVMILVGLVGVLTSILTALNERRREMAILRAVGARPWHIFALLVAEAGFVAFTGALLGLLAAHLGLAAAGPWAASRYGLALLDAGPSIRDALILAGVTAAALALGAWPAWRAFRAALADGLAVRA